MVFESGMNWVFMKPKEIRKTLDNFHNQNKEYNWLLKENKMENETKTMKGQRLTVNEIKLELNGRDASKIDKVRINTDAGDITWKPKKEVTRFVNSFPTVRFESMTLDDIPNILREIQTICNKNGKCEVEADYVILNTLDAENKPIRYRFIRTAKFLDNWFILSDKESEVKEESF